MALISLFFTQRAKVGQLDLDASISETHEATASLTQSEVESGANITDHMTLAPLKLTLEGIVSKTPLGTSALVSSAATAAGGAIAKAVGGNQKLLGAAATLGAGSIGGLVSNAFGLDGLDIGKGKSREPRDVYSYLLELRDRRTPFQVVTALKLYKDMVVTSVSAPRSSQLREALKFTLVLEQVKIVQAKTIDIGSVSSLGGAASQATKLGKQGATEATSKTGSDATILYQLIKGG